MTKIDRHFLQFYNQCAALGARAKEMGAESRKFGSNRAGTGSRFKMALAIAGFVSEPLSCHGSPMGAK